MKLKSISLDEVTSAIGGIVLVGCAFVAIGYSGWLILNITVLPVILLIISPVISIFLIRRKPFSYKLIYNSVVFLLILSASCSLRVFSSFSKHQTYIDNVFLSGDRQFLETVETEGNEDEPASYEDKYAFYSDQKTGMNLIEFSLAVLCIVSPYLCYASLNVDPENSKT